jgi:hypothetical protein
MTLVYVYDENNPHRYCDMGQIEVTTGEDLRLGRRAYIDHRCEECKLVDNLLESETMKHCDHCGQKLPIKKFYTKGLKVRCNTCITELGAYKR